LHYPQKSTKHRFYRFHRAFHVLFTHCIEHGQRHDALAERVGQRIVSLPMFNVMRKEDVVRAVETVKSVLG